MQSQWPCVCRLPPPRIHALGLVRMAASSGGQGASGSATSTAMPGFTSAGVLVTGMHWQTQVGAGAARQSQSEGAVPAALPAGDWPPPAAALTPERRAERRQREHSTSRTPPGVGARLRFDLERLTLHPEDHMEQDEGVPLAEQRLARARQEDAAESGASGPPPDSAVRGAAAAEAPARPALGGATAGPQPWPLPPTIAATGVTAMATGTAGEAAATAAAAAATAATAATTPAATAPAPAAAAPAPLATRDPSVQPCCPLCFTMCVSSSLLPSALMGIVSGWAGGDTRSV